MQPNKVRQRKLTQAHRQRSWRVSIAGKSKNFVPIRPMSYFEVLQYIKCNFSDCLVEVGV